MNSPKLTFDLAAQDLNPGFMNRKQCLDLVVKASKDKKLLQCLWTTLFFVK